VSPASSAISSVRSIGKPKVSCSRNACRRRASSARLRVLDARVEDRRAAASVRRNVSSSPSASASARPSLLDSGTRRASRSRDAVEQLAEASAVDAEQAHRADRAAQQAAQDVAAALVAPA
jgi:hypothetical protein